MASPDRALRRIVSFALWGVISAAAAGVRAESLPQDLAATVGNASARVHGDDLEVSTGILSRTWHWTGKGLSTISIRDARTGKEYAVAPQHPCDWDLPGAIAREGTAATLVGAEAHVSDDDGFSTRHLEIISTIRYDKPHLEVQYVVWAFPDAPGLRTQLRVKALPGFEPRGLPEAENTHTDCGATFLTPSARTEYLPLNFAIQNERLYWGYYNNPGNRHDQSQDMLKEQVVRGWPIFLREDIDWASGMAVKYGDAGLIVVKESPKCVNQQAHYTGAFYASPAGLAVTGWGLTPREILPDRFRECWAAWCIVYQGGDDGIQLALKQFDRARYPVFPRRDAIILSNTWGPANPGGAQFTSENFIKKEMPLLADLGVEVLQIDDGWQKAGGGSGASGFLPKYKNGWKDLKAEANQYGIRFGLWVAIRNARLADLKENLDELGYISWKADFEHLADRSDYENRITKLRQVMKHAWMNTQFTLCPEYDDPRYGWYFAKEYGSIYFQNIQEGRPAHLTMVPFQVLRQHWLMAKYFNADKLQVLLQNPKRTRKDISDAWQHSHGYCFAMGLPFVPVFFQSAQYLDDAGRAELKDLIKIYKANRDDIFTSLTFPIGDLPDNQSWSGFQMVSWQGGGYLLIFRELHNTEPKHALQLKFLAGKTISLMDTRTGTAETVPVGPDGTLILEIPQPAGYRLLKYSVK